MTPSLLVCTVLLTLNAGKAAVARPAPSQFMLDGDLSEWNPGHFSTSPVIEITSGTSFLEEGRIESDQDQSARVYVSFDAQRLIIGAIITDDQVISNHRHADMWQGDLFEAIIPRARGGVLHVGVNPVGDVHFFSAVTQNTLAPEGAIRAATRIEKDGWVIELSIPFRAFGAQGTEAQWPFNIALKDADPSEPVVAHRVWSGLRHQLRASAGTVYFDRAAPRPTAAFNCPPYTKTFVLTSPLQVKGAEVAVENEPVRLRIVNFQSAFENWANFWSSFRPERIRAGLDVAKTLKANAIRIFVFDDVFGLEQLRPEMLERLHFVVREAATRGLLSIVTFFPFKKEFRPQWHERMQAHLEGVVRSFVGDPAIAMWDLMNEPDHLWAQVDGGVSASDVSRWAVRMYDAVKAADPTHLVTVGLAGHFLKTTPFVAQETLPFVDVISFHFYGDLPTLDQTIERARAGLQKPLVLQEFGFTSLYVSDDEASRQLEQICHASATAALSGVGLWELFDHPVGSMSQVTPRWAQTVENDFGLVTVDGRFKAQARAFCECLRVPAFRVSPKMMTSPGAVVDCPTCRSTTKK